MPARGFCSSCTPLGKPLQAKRAKRAPARASQSLSLHFCIRWVRFANRLKPVAGKLNKLSKLKRALGEPNPERV